MSDTCLLIGDIGGTNARFALVDPEKPGYYAEQSLRYVDFDSPEASIQAYLGSVQTSSPVTICIAVAGPIIDRAVHFTNNDWQLSEQSLTTTFGTEQVRLLNDFEAVAYSLPLLGDVDTRLIGGAPAIALAQLNFRLGVIGPGTGLGAAGLVRQDGVVAPLVTEAGHVGFAPENELQETVKQRLLARYERVSDEHLISGPGIENIYQALVQKATNAKTPTAAEIFERYHANADPFATQAVELFYEIFGQAAGNFALSLGAFHGIYLAGGIAQRYPDLLATSRFREGFENKGPHRGLLARVPTLLIQHPQPGLLGASFVARTMWQSVK